MVRCGSSLSNAIFHLAHLKFPALYQSPCFLSDFLDILIVSSIPLFLYQNQLSQLLAYLLNPLMTSSPPRSHQPMTQPPNHGSPLPPPSPVAPIIHILSPRLRKIHNTPHPLANISHPLELPDWGILWREDFCFLPQRYFSMI